MAHIYQTKDKTGKPHPRWKIQYTDYAGKRRTVTGYTSKKETEKLANQLEDKHRRIRDGLEAPPGSPQKHKSDNVSAVIEEYLSWGEAQGGRGGCPWSEGHGRMRKTHLTWWKDKLGLDILADLDNILPKAEGLLRSLGKKGKAGKTQHHYGDCLKSFCTWCVDRGYLAENPLRRLKLVSPAPKTKRRAMTIEEVQTLLEKTPDHKRLLYEVAICTGLRAKELKSLTVEDLDTVNCGLTLHPEWTKNRKAGFQCLPKSLVMKLDELAQSGLVLKFYSGFNTRKDSTRDYPENPLLFVPRNPARALKVDLREAGIPEKTKEGKLDFHALRTAYITFLLESNANLKEAMSLARHATPDLTVNAYARTREKRLHEITESIAERILPKPTRTDEKSSITGA